MRRNKKGIKLPRNWRSRIEIKKEIIGSDIHYCLSFKKDRIPKGFAKEIGNFNVEKKSPHFVDGPWLEEYFFNRRLGLMMYEAAMKDLGCISTKWDNTTELGRRAWQSLMRRWPHKVEWNDIIITVYYKSRLPVC